MELNPKPELALAKRNLPPSLLQAIIHIFSQNISGVILVGGTALSGFYTSHRKSEDLDLFVDSEINFKSCLLAIKSLESLGFKFSNQSQSLNYFHSLVITLICMVH